jgi:hypothetical protein
MGLWHVAKLRRRRAGNGVVGKEITYPPPTLSDGMRARADFHKCHVGKRGARINDTQRWRNG